MLKIILCKLIYLNKEIYYLLHSLQSVDVIFTLLVINFIENINGEGFGEGLGAVEQIKIHDTKIDGRKLVPGAGIESSIIPAWA